LFEREHRMFDDSYPFEGKKGLPGKTA